MSKEIIIDNIEIQVRKKRIKNMYIRVLPPDGRVRISAPKFTSIRAIEKFAESRMQWIKENQKKIQKSAAAKDLKYMSGEKHKLWGKDYTLEIMPLEEKKKVPKEKRVFLDNDKIIMMVKPKETPETRKKLLDLWYKRQLESILPNIISASEKITSKQGNEWRIRNMKTRWGSCNIVKKRIWLNLQLAKKDKELIQYVVIHELTHLYVAAHNAKFYSHMDKFCPDWKEKRKRLNSI